MATITNELVDKLSNLQPQVWQTVSLRVSEACDNMVTFNAPLTLKTPSSDIFSELNSPHLIIQFAFASAPEQSCCILLDQDTAASYASFLRGEAYSDVDENIITDIRPALEAIVQGICVAVGNMRNDPVVASGLAIRYQLFNPPQNLSKSSELIRVNVALSGEEMSGTVIWIMDAEMAYAVTGMQLPEEADEGPYEQVSGSGRSHAPSDGSDPGSLELLLDIPLEISVELGRVKMLVKDVIDLGTGSIIEIDKAAGEPVDVLVNGRLVARGEVVVIEDNFGVRITEILTPQERLQRLSEVA